MSLQMEGGDHQEYLEKHEISQLFVSVVEALLVEKPEKPIVHIIAHFQKKFPGEFLEVAGGEKGSSANSSPDDDDDSDDDDDDDDEVGDMQAMPPPIPKGGGRRRVSVSAESMDANKGVAHKAPVFEKEGVVQERIRTMLKSNMLFKHLDEKQVQILVDALEPTESPVGTEIIKQGDMGDYFYLMDSGICEIFKDGELVQTCTEAMSFGELALMYNSPRAATVTAKENVKLYKLDRATFKVILTDTTIKKREQYSSFLENVSILAHLQENERLTVADALTSVSFNEGEKVIVEGDAGNGFYILEEGTVECFKGGESVGTLEPGAYFGEVALLTDRPRQATVVAKGAVKCLSLERKTFKRVMGPLEDILQRNMSAYSGSTEGAGSIAV